MLPTPLEHIVGRWRNPSRWAYLIVAPWVIGIVASVWAACADGAVATRQRAAEATVVAHEPEDHDRYRYAFTSGGRVYSGWDSPANRDFRLGQLVTVYYDPADPSTNALADFGERRLDALGPVAVLTAGVVSGVVVIGMLRRDARLRRRTPELSGDRRA